MERRYILTRTHTTTVHSYNDPATPAAATPAVRAAESAAPRPPHGHPLSRRAAALLLTLSTLILSLASPLHAEEPLGPTARIRLGFETRHLTPAQAQMITSGTVPGGKDEDNRWGDHYIDIWQYAYFEMKTFSKYVTKSGNNWNFGPKTDMNTMSFAMQKKDGTLDDTRDIARIAPEYGRPTAAPYPDGYNDITQARYEEGVNAFYVTRGMDDGIKGWAAKNAANPGEAAGALYYNSMVDTFYDENNNPWYRVKMALIRFVWRSPQSFYVNFVGDNSVKSDKSAGVCNWNLKYDGAPMKACEDYGDWSQAAGIDPTVNGGCGPAYKDCMKYIRGGVEIISGFEATIDDPEKACPTADVTTAYKIQRYISGATWTQTKYEVQFHNPTTNAWESSKIAVQKDLATTDPDFDPTLPFINYKSGSKNAPTETAPTEATLTLPAAVHKGFYDQFRLIVHVPKASLADPNGQFVLGNDTSYTYTAALSYYDDPKLMAAFFDPFGDTYVAPINAYGKKHNVRGDTVVGITESASVCAIPVSMYKNSPISEKKALNSGDIDDVFAEVFSAFETADVSLYYNTNLVTEFEKIVEGQSDNTERTEPIELISGYYYLQYGSAKNTCVYYTDTVYVKIPKLLPAPILSLYVGEDCAYDKFEITAMAVDYTSVDADGWEWALGYRADKNYPQESLVNHDKWVKIKGNKQNIQVGAPNSIYVDDASLTYETKAEQGTNASQFVAHMGTDLAGTFAGYETSLACADMKDLYEFLFEDSVEDAMRSHSAVWPKKVVGDTQFEFSDIYPNFTTVSGLNIEGSAIYARYTKDGDVSEWGPLVPACVKPAGSISPGVACYGIAVNHDGISSKAKTWEYGTVPTCNNYKEVVSGDSVTLRCYIDFDQTKEIKPNTNGELLKKITIANAMFAIEWQVWEDGKWKTFHISGVNSFDDGKLNSIKYAGLEFPYIETTRVVNKAEKYRILVVTNAECKKTAAELCYRIGGFEEDSEYDAGEYDTVVSVSILANEPVLKGKKRAEGDNTYNETVSICAGNQINLRVNKFFVNNAPASNNVMIYWEDSISTDIPGGHVWKNAANMVSMGGNMNNPSGRFDTIKTFRPSSPNGKIYYRARLVDGDRKSVTGMVTVTINSVTKTYIGYESTSTGLRKSKDAGYCYGEKIDFYPSQKRGENVKYSSVPSGITYQVAMDPTGFSGTVGEDVVESETGDAVDYGDIVDANDFPVTLYWRIKVANGECAEYSDTAAVTVYEKFEFSIAPLTTSVCEKTGGADATLKATVASGGNHEVVYTWMYKDASDKYVNDPTSNSDSYTRKYPIFGSAPHTDKVKAKGYMIFGDKNTNVPEDTVRCHYSVGQDATITVKAKPATPTLTVNINPICEESSSGTNGVKATVSPTPAGSYTYIWYKDNVKQTSTGTTCEVVPANTTVTLAHATPVYKVRGVLTVEGCPSDTAYSEGASLTVHAKPEKPVVDLDEEAKACPGSPATLTARVSNNTAANTTYSYQWKNSTGGGIGSPTTSPADLTQNAPAQDVSNLYYLYVTATTNTTPACTNNSDVPAVANMAKITGLNCSAPSSTSVEACPEDETIKSFVLTCASGADAIAVTKKSDDTPVAATFNPSTLGPTVTQCTITLVTKPTVTTEYKITVTRNNMALTPAIATYTILPTPAIPVTMSDVSKCPGEAVTFTANATKPTGGSIEGYTWQGRGNAWSTGTDKTISFTAVSDSNGTYKVTVSGKTDKLCKVTGTTTATFSPKNLPAVPTFTNISDTTFCSNENYTFTLPVTTTESNVSYQWIGRTGTSGDFTLIEGAKSTTLSICKTGGSCSNGVSMPASGTANWRLAATSTSSDGCKRYDTSAIVNATIAAPPTVNVLGNNASVCTGKEVTLSVSCTPAANEEVINYEWKLDNNVKASGATASTYKITDAKTSDGGKYTVTVTVKNKVTGCTNTGQKEITLTVNSTPTNLTVILPDQQICSTGGTLTLTATSSATGSSSVSYRWFRGADTSTFMAATGATNTYSPTEPTVTADDPVTTQDYTVKATFGGNGCSAEATKTGKVTVVKTPASITITFNPTSVTVCKGSPIDVTGSVSSADDPKAHYSYTWTPSAPRGSTNANINIASADLTDSKTYTLKVDAEYKDAATNKSCTATKSGSITLKVTKPTDLTGAKITGAETDKCTSTGTATLGISGIVAGDPAQTIKYQWVKDGTDITGANNATYSIDKKMASNGTYSCKLSVESIPATPNNCTAEETPSAVVAYKMCTNEVLVASTSPNQDRNVAIICQKGNENSPAAVMYTATDEAELVNKVTWYKQEVASATPPTPSTATATATKIKEVTSFSWPTALTLTQQEVFVDNSGNPENAPKNYYVWVKVERNDGSVISYSNTYRFVKVENAPKVTPTINAAEKIVCKGTAFSFTVSGTKPGDPDNAAYSGLTATSENLTYIWAKNGSTLTGNTSNTQNAVVSTPVVDEAYSAKAVSAYKYVSGSLINTCRDTGVAAEGKITVKAPPTVTLTIDQSEACANAIPDNLTLTATPNPDTATLTWKRTAPSAKTLTASGKTCTITVADMVLPTGTSDVKNTYEVTAAGWVCNNASATADFTVKAVPSLASVDITAGTSYCNNSAHELTATPKTSTGTMTATADIPLAYQWQDSSTGAQWNTVGTSSKYSIPTNKTPGTYFYRCTVTAGKSGSCQVVKTSAVQAFRIDGPTVAGTLTQPVDVCSNAAEANYPKFTLNGNTGSVQKWELNGTEVTGKKDSTYTLNLADNTIKSLINASSSRVTEFTVKVTVKNGVCAEASTNKKVKIYKKIDNITLTPNVDECLASGKTSVSYSPTALSGAGETFTWEYAGGTGFVDLGSVTKSTATTANLGFGAGQQPKYNHDTTYTVQVKISSTVCGDVTSDPITVKLKRRSAIPAITVSQSPVCEGEGYIVTATRPGADAVEWTVSKNSAAATTIASGDITSATPPARTDTYNVAANSERTAYGTYTYKVTDNLGCSPQFNSVTVTVNQKPVAGVVEAALGGVFCSTGDDVVVNHKSGTVKPTTSNINWQVCTDTSDLNTRVPGLEKINQTNNVAYTGSGFTAGTTYYIRYQVPATESCDPAYSNWVKVSIIQAVTVSPLDALGTLCEGSDASITFTVANGLEYELWSNTANNNTGGTKVKDGTSDGSAVTYNFTATPNGTALQTSRYYYLKVKDTTYKGTGTCGAAKTAVTTLNVDAKPVGGTLVFDNNGGKALTANVAEHAYLKLTDATGNPLTVYASTQPQGGSYGTESSIGDIAVGTNKDVPLQVAHMEKTMFWVVAQNGVCPDANSDTVVVTVESANQPTLGITSPICEIVTDATLTINVPEDLKVSFKWPDITWQRRTYTSGMAEDVEWVDITSVVVPTVSGTPTTITATDPDAKTLAAGTYQYRYRYDYGVEGYSNPATLQIDATSKGGKLTVDNRVVCEGDASPVLSLTGDVKGNIVANSLKSGTVIGSITTAVSGATTTPSKVYEVPTTAANVGKKIYQLQVKNGACDPVNSDTVAVEVIQKPVAGSLSVGNPLCYNSGTATVTLGGKTGSSIVWSTSSTRNGEYADVPNTDALTYTVGPRTERIFVKATVNTNAVCAAKTTEPLEVAVYDTLEIKTQPADKTVMGTGQTATFTVVAATAGMTYTDGSAYVAVSAGTYQWYKSDGSILSGTDYSGVNTATLTVNNAENHNGEAFYCVVTDNKCSRSIQSNNAKISAVEKLVPGSTHSLTQCDCYYPSDPATYYVTGTVGQGNFYYKWQVSQSSAEPTSDDDWKILETDFADLYGTAIDKGDTIIFSAVGKVMMEDINWIRALVHDDYTETWTPTEGDIIKVCKQPKPVYSFAGNTVCSRDASGSAVPFAFTADPSEAIDGREITYAYKLPSEADFTKITNGKTVNLGGKTLSFAIASDNLTIPASSAIPFEADSMVIRMEVRSCYTPAPLATNTDTTMYAVLRVDAPVQITARAKDTIICKDASFNMETGYSLLNKTIAGNEVSAKWYKEGTSGEQDSKTYPGNADGVAVHAFENVTADDVGVWYVDLSTNLCPAVTDTITVVVQNAPSIVSLETTEACAGSEIVLTAKIDETSSPAPYTITWERRDRDGQWRDVLGAGVSSDSIAASYTTGSTNKPHYLRLKKGSPADAGRYRAVLTITGSCASTDNTHEVDVKVNMKPEFKELSKGPNVFLTADATTTVAVTYVSANDLAQRYNVENGYIVIPEPTYKWSFKTPEGEYKESTDDEFINLVPSGHGTSTITIKGVDGFSGTWFKAEMTNDCGSSESTADTLVISDRFAISGVSGPQKPVCEGNEVEITVSTTGVASYVEWQVSTDGGSVWTPISPLTSADTTWNADNSYTFILHDVKAGMDGFKYRAVVHDDANPVVWDTMKDEAVVTLQVFSDKSPFALTIRDGGDDAMQDGDVRDQHQVIFKIYDTVSGTGNDAYKQYYNKLCVMRRITKDSSAVVENTCVDAPAEGFVFPVTIPSFNANVEEHDSTQYFVMAYNYCGKVASDTNLLRVYDTLIVRWIADTIIYTEAGDKWSVDSLGEIVPGRLIDVYSAFDSTPLQAHVFLCDSTFIIFNDTTLKGFMNPVDEEEENTHSSRWWMKKPYEEEWEFANPYDWTSRNTEHKGAVGTTSDGFFTLEDDSLQIKGWGVNNLYCDSTSVLTIHMLPRLKTGDLRLTPPALSLCEGAPGNDQTFVLSSIRYESEIWEHAAASAHLHWQYRTPESDAWVDVDTNAGRTSWHFGTVTAEHNGWKIRAFVSVPCGTDTVEALISVTTPVVRLASDSVCAGDELVLTATVENLEDPVFEWSVDGQKVASTGAEYRTSTLPAGAHNIEVLASDAKLCAASDTKVAVVYALPQIKADIADTIMKNIDTTSVWVKGEGDYTYEWTPKTGLLDATSDSTLLSGLEPQQEPYWYKVTATDEHGCQAKDSVHVIIESNFTIDSFSIVTVVPPVLDLEGGRLPGYPSEPEDSYYPGLGGSQFGGELMFRNDTVADLWICAHNTALIHFNVRGGEKPIQYTWTIDGNATLVYPVDAEAGREYSFKNPETDSVFGIFFPDTTTDTMYCDIKDKTGVGGRIKIRVHYYKPEMFYLEVTPKVTSGKYYEQQAMNFFVRPDRDWLTTWIVVRDGEVKDSVTNRKMNRQMSFTKEEGDETSIWISTVDRHGCRIWDSVSVHIIPLPNVLLLGDPINGVLFPEFEVEVTSSWGLKVKAFEDRNGNGSSRGWDGRTKSGTYVVAGTYYYRAKIPTLDKQGYMIVNGAVTVVNNK